MSTISGIDIDLFAKSPSPEELAEIVAGWDSMLQARFLCALGEQLQFKYGYSMHSQVALAIRDLNYLETENVSGYGSAFIEALSECQLAMADKDAQS